MCTASPARQSDVRPGSPGSEFSSLGVPTAESLRSHPRIFPFLRRHLAETRCDDDCRSTATVAWVLQTSKQVASKNSNTINAAKQESLEHRFSGSPAGGHRFGGSYFWLALQPTS